MSEQPKKEQDDTAPAAATTEEGGFEEGGAEPSSPSSSSESGSEESRGSLSSSSSSSSASSFLVVERRQQQPPPRKKSRLGDSSDGGSSGSGSALHPVAAAAAAETMEAAAVVQPLQPPLSTKAQLQELLGPLQQLRALLEPVVNEFARSKKRKVPQPQQQQPKPKPKPTLPPLQLSEPQVWGTLVSHTQGVEDCPMYGIVTTVGRSQKCQLCIEDPDLSSFVCKLTMPPSPKVECVTRQILVDGKPVSRGQVADLRTGTELRFQSLKKSYAFVLRIEAHGVHVEKQHQQRLEAFKLVKPSPAAAAAPPPPHPPASPAAAPPAPVVQPAPTPMATPKMSPLLPTGPRRVLDFFAGKALPAPPPASATSDEHPLSSLPSSHADPLAGIFSSEFGSLLRKPSEGSLPFLTPLPAAAVVVPPSLEDPLMLAAKEAQQQQQPAEAKATTEETGATTMSPPKPTASTTSLPPAPLPVPTELPPSQPMEISIPDAASADPTSSSYAAPPTPLPPPPPAPAVTPAQAALALLEDAAASKEKCKQHFRAKLLRPEDISSSFENFAYYLADDVRSMLVNSAYVFLQRPEFSRFASDLASLSRRIILTGPAGTELYQEALGKALAKHFSAAILELDAGDFEQRSPSGERPQSSGERSQRMAVRGIAAVLGSLTSEIGGGNGGAGASASSEEDEDDPRSLLPEGRAPGRFALGRGTLFRKGDRVRYSSNVAVLHSDRTRQDRGPGSGARGTVVLTIDENPRKVGVQFDKPFPGGVDLGGMCKDGHGMFVDSSAMMLEDDAAEDELFEAAVEVLSESAPAVLLLRNVDKSIAVSPERYANFKRVLNDLAKTEKPVILLGTTTLPIEAIASQGGGAGGPGAAAGGAAGGMSMRPSNQLLLPKAPRHPALMDFSLFDHLTRPSDDGKSSVLAGLSRETIRAGRMLGKIFPTRIPISLPKDGDQLVEWREQIDRDTERVRSQANCIAISRALVRSNVVVAEGAEGSEDASGVLASLPSLRKQVFAPDAVDKIVGWAISRHLQRTSPAEVRNGRLVISLGSVGEAVEMLQSGEPDARRRSLMEVETENEFEKRLLSDVIPPEEVSLSFSDVGALDEVKDTLRELVMLPLQRPELFRRGNLTRPCKGILLFGPPGTGKTMLAKAVATESGANFINVTMSSIASKWFGEGEKFVRAVFSLASKIAPSVIFVDEVDSILGKRERAGEHEAMRKIKNEFMMSWDGLRTRQSERVLVLAATNRPMDLDDAVLRRLNKRILVDLPTAENREKILRVILKGEDLAPDFDIAALAKKTEGFSGSDLKNLCVVAAHQPIRELLQRERESRGKPLPPTLPETPMPSVTPDSSASAAAAVAAPLAAKGGGGELRALTMADFDQAMTEVSKSVHEDAFSLTELRRWNEMYGDGGTHTAATLSYFL